MRDTKNQSSKLRILWHSVAPWIASGYGKTTREVCTRLPKYGFEVLISAYYGADPGGIPSYPIPVLPSKDGPFGISSASEYCKQFKVDAGLLFSDWWAFSDFPKIIPNATLYSPMDQVGYPEEIVNFTKDYFEIISLCKWQQGIKSNCIYHGVNVNIFKPNKKEARTKIILT
ncbi:MAG: hypothetical protein ACQCN3_07335 [Candidatus Bathyarchaeia archaeon]